MQPNNNKPGLALSSFGMTDVGLVREHDEDYYDIDKKQGLRESPRCHYKSYHPGCYFSRKDNITIIAISVKKKAITPKK